MNQDHHTNQVRLKAVHNSLGELRDKVVFVGGSTVSLYADIPTLNIRPTDDVDIIVELLNYNNRTELEAKLLELGFQHDIESGIICRYRVKSIIVDIMPTTSESIGFSNRWYPMGFHTAMNYMLDDIIIKILNAPMFITTKLEAFKDRGSDGRTSHDFEDIVYVLENRQSIWEEMANASEEIKDYLRYEFTQLRKNPSLYEWIDCHIQFDSPPPTYLILQEIDKFIG
jgi:hypothetical protein